MNISFAGPSFFGQADEDLFFLALSQLPAYQGVGGSGRDTDLILRDPIDSDTADRLLSLFLRWEIDTRPLLHLRPADSANNGLWEIECERAPTESRTAR